MFRKWTVAAGLAGLLAAPPAARAEDAARIAALEDRIRALEDSLAQSQRLTSSQLDVPTKEAPVATAAGVSGFLSSLQVGGHVAGSYLYDFNNPDTNSFTNALCQFNCNHNEFSFDAAKLELGHPAREPGSGGFQLDFLFGQNAAILRGLAPPDDGPVVASGASDTDLFIQQAYVAYNWNGVGLKLGKFETLLGYELLDSNANATVTHGLLFTFAIPLFHTGALANGSIGENLTWAAGVVNGFNNSRDQGDNKGLVGQLAWTSGPWFLSASSYVGTLGETRTRLSTGALVGDDRPLTQIYDFIVRFVPSESVTTWVNVDLGMTERRSDPPGGVIAVGSDPRFWGVSTGVTYTFSEKTAFTLRGEYMKDDQGSRLGGLVPLDPLSLDEIDAYSFSATLAYQLSDSVKTRLEYRHDLVDCHTRGCSFFFESGEAARTQKMNDLGIAEVVYSFD